MPCRALSAVYMEKNRVPFRNTVFLYFLCRKKVNVKKMKTSTTLSSILAAAALLSCCSRVQSSSPAEDIPSGEPVCLQDIALLLSSSDLGCDRMREVHDAVRSSAGNGYDEEYTMKNLFACPGSGVGDELLKSKAVLREYERPLRELFREHFSRIAGGGTKAGMTADEYLSYLERSDMQLYWPYSDAWDGVSAPIVTFCPAGEQDSNTGWYLDADGSVKEILVTEELAMQRPVWVVNRNDDASCVSLEVMKKNHPEWGEGGEIVIRPAGQSGVSGLSIDSEGAVPAAASVLRPQSLTAPGRALVLKDFTMLRHYDNWLRGASEFFIKTGSVENFTASTEAELKLYDPTVTDFMVVVRRKELGIAHQLNTVLVSDWTQLLDSCAFMITEDDGGTITSWNCSAVVKYDSKSYGFELKIPYRSSDDIVWRGQLSRRYIESVSDLTGYFGDVTLTFSIKDL